MYFVNVLTESDMARAHRLYPPTPDASVLAGAYTCLIEAINLFVKESVNGVVAGLTKRTDREAIVMGLYYRSAAFSQTVVLLKQAVHHQSLLSAERSVIELCIDMSLIHANVFKDGVERVHAFTDLQRLRSSERLAGFYEKHNEFGPISKDATKHLDYVKLNEVRIEAELKRLFGSNKSGKAIRPEHWSGMNLIERSEKLDVAMQNRVMISYDRRNHAIHTGLVNASFSVENFVQMSAIALQHIGECMLIELRLIGEELLLKHAVPEYIEKLAELEQVSTFAFADKILQKHGEPCRFGFDEGHPPKVTLA